MKVTKNYLFRAQEARNFGPVSACISMPCLFVPVPAFLARIHTLITKGPFTVVFFEKNITKAVHYKTALQSHGDEETGYIGSFGEDSVESVRDNANRNEEVNMSLVTNQNLSDLTVD